MPSKQKELYNLLKEFQEEWPLKKVKGMSIDEYVIGNKKKNGFCYWIEKKTDKLGGISGIGDGGSFMHGIFQTTKRYKKNTKYDSNGKYAWRLRFGKKNSKTVFSRIKKKIILLIKAAINNDFGTIENELDVKTKERLSPKLGWKIVYLYSKHGRIFPAFEKNYLSFVAKSLGYNSPDENSTYMGLQNYIHRNRDKSINLFDFADDMWPLFNGKYPKDEDEDLGTEGGEKIRKHLFDEKKLKQRNASLAKKLKAGVNKCDACKNGVNKQYKIKDSTIFELHHIKPFNLPYWSKVRKVKKENYAILCPNCHRAIHKHMSVKNEESISIKKFITIIK
jgi:hypothetical protein